MKSLFSSNLFQIAILNLDGVNDLAWMKWYSGSTRNSPDFLSFQRIQLLIQCSMLSILWRKASSFYSNFLFIACMGWLYFFYRVFTILEMAFLLIKKLLVLATFNKLRSSWWLGSQRYFSNSTRFFYSIYQQTNCLINLFFRTNQDSWESLYSFLEWSPNNFCLSAFLRKVIVYFRKSMHQFNQRISSSQKPSVLVCRCDFESKLLSRMFFTGILRFVRLSTKRKGSQSKGVEQEE